MPMKCPRGQNQLISLTRKIALWKLKSNAYSWHKCTASIEILANDQSHGMSLTCIRPIVRYTNLDLAYIMHLSSWKALYHCPHQIRQALLSAMGISLASGHNWQILTTSLLLPGEADSMSMDKVNSAKLNAWTTRVFIIPPFVILWK